MKKKISIFLVAFLMLFNFYQIDYNTKKIEINKPVEAIEPVTASIIASVMASLALSLGFRLIDSTSDSFTRGCMSLYNNFTTNTKNLIDRIAGKKQAGDSTYDVTPAELESFGNELSSAITDISNGGQDFLYKKRFDYIINDLNVGQSLTYESFSFNSANFEKDVYYRYYASIILTDGTRFNITDYDLSDIFIKFNSDNTFNFYINTENKFDSLIGSTYTSFDLRYVYSINIKPGLSFYFLPSNLMSSTNYRYIVPSDNKSMVNNVSHFELQIGDEIVQEPLVINVGQMNISELISALQASGALNSQGAVTQQFITNYDTAVPADIYTDINAKSVVDSLYDGADTNVPEVPQDWTILQSMYQVLRDLYQNVRTGINSVSNTLSQILTNVKAIPQTIATTFTSLFVPPEGFMTPLITDFQNSMSTKFGDRTIDLTQFSSTRIPEDIEITIMGQTVKVFESQPLIDFVEAVRAWIIGFIGILAMIYNFNNVYRLFAGAEYVGSTGSSQLNTQGMLQGSNDSGFLKLGGGK